MSVEDFIIYVYCCVEDICLTIVNQPLRSRGFMPKLSDAEVITMEIMGKFMGKDHDKGIWRYFHNLWHGWFPTQNAYHYEQADIFDLAAIYAEGISSNLLRCKTYCSLR